MRGPLPVRRWHPLYGSGGEGVNGGYTKWPVCHTYDRRPFFREPCAAPDRPAARRCRPLPRRLDGVLQSKASNDPVEGSALFVFAIGLFTTPTGAAA